MSQNFISSEALADLDEIFDYFAARSVEAGEKFASEFKKKGSPVLEVIIKYNERA